MECTHRSAGRTATVVTSDHSGNVAVEVSNDLCTNPSLAVVRPEPPIEAASSCSEADVSVVESKFGGIGRPSAGESERRRMEFVRLIASGASLGEAQRGARVSLQRALDLLDPPEMRKLAARAVELRQVA
jgi:hypothetical protein